MYHFEIRLNHTGKSQSLMEFKRILTTFPHGENAAPVSCSLLNDGSVVLVLITCPITLSEQFLCAVKRPLMTQYCDIPRIRGGTDTIRSYCLFRRQPAGLALELYSDPTSLKGAREASHRWYRRSACSSSTPLRLYPAISN